MGGWRGGCEPSSARAGVILVVTGLLTEARVAAGEGVRTVSGGGRTPLLVERMEAALADGEVRAVLSFGVAGALLPGLRVGDALVAAVVRDGRARLYADPAWTARLAALTGARPADIAGVDATAATPDAKAALRLRTGAVAVDMESHIAARAAAARGLPFAALRVISDLASDSLPPAAVAGMRPDGGTDAAAVLRGLARDPRQLPALIRTARDAAAAFRTLRHARRAAGAAFGFSAGSRPIGAD